MIGITFFLSIIRKIMKDFEMNLKDYSVFKGKTGVVLTYHSGLTDSMG